MKNAIKSAAIRTVLAGLALGIAFLTGSQAAAQSTPGPVSPQVGSQPDSATQKPTPDQPIRVRVAEVSTPVVVREANGELALDVATREVHVFDNGVEQKIDNFEMGGAPLSVAIVAETSSRIEPLLPALRRSGILFTQTVLGQSGDATIIGYDDQVNTLLDFTSDRDAIEKTITNLQPGNSGARLYDAMGEAVEKLRNRSASRRRVVIVMAEAVDSGSEEKLGEVLRKADLANVTIYSVGLSSTAAQVRGSQKQAAAPSATPPGTFGMAPIPGMPQTPTSEAQRGGNIDALALATWVIQHATEKIREHPLEISSAATGGLSQSTTRDSSIESAIDEIGGELNAQYTLSYHPTGNTSDGYHEIKVVVDRREVKVRARPGYYLETP